ncbi:uncharacterized protein LOC143912216 isoform X2 [Arctopsyche grandis]|uniref:uncharacterized protein LOC143912216 isoform X2 n=1 Tax=Arctopsyche grandis TaxID=121162 RepID=UPI00406D9355
MAGLEDDQQFCLRWNNHQSTLISVFDTLLEKGIHVDCTLAAEGRTLNAHKVVLSACSPYFEAVLSQQYDKHPIIILKDVKFAELRAMMDYMYRGEVNISQDQLGALLKAAESLQIKGLSDNKPPPTTPPASSPPLKVRSTRGSPVEEEGSRDGSVSPSRRKRKRHRSSLSPVTELPRAITPPATLTNCSDSQPDDIQKKIEDAIDTPAILTKTENNIDNNVEPKAEFTFDGNEDSVEDLTMDEDADSETEQTGACSSQPVPDGGNVPGFTWQVDRSHDETTAVPEGPRDTQDSTCFSMRDSIDRTETNEDASAEDSSFGYSGFVTRTRKGMAMSKIECTLERSTRSNKILSKHNADSDERLTLDSELNAMKSNKSLPCAQYASAKGFTCPNCQRTYNARKNLVRHINLECGREPQYKCPHCPHGNHRRNELKRHMEKKHVSQMFP